LAGGSGRSAIRAVSFFRLREPAEGGLGGGPGNFAAAGMFTGAAGLATGRSGAEVGDEGGDGGAFGGNGGGAVEAGGSEGVDGGRAGRLIRTVSRDSLLALGAAAGCGGNAMRTVSFLGSFESAMRIWRVGPENCAKIDHLSLVNLIFAAKGCLSEEIVSPACSDCAPHKFSGRRRLGQNYPRIDIRRVGFAASDMRLID